MASAPKKGVAGLRMDNNDADTSTLPTVSDQSDLADALDSLNIASNHDDGDRNSDNDQT